MKDSGGTLDRPSPYGWLRAILRMPILLYRLRLGWLLGHRFLLLAHVGRKTGLRRYTVLEVVRYSQESHTCVVGSGWGEKSQWLRNVSACPEVEVTLGTATRRARAERMQHAGAAAALAEYARKHPAAFKRLGRVMLGADYKGEADDLRRLAERVPLVELRMAADG